MKIDNVNENTIIKSTLPIQGQTFKINATAQAFKILTDNLYQDKIPTIIRELSCNAYDSQVLNGNPEQPFDIFVPSCLEPYFYIRDYGVGLTEEQVFNLYTTYFESTKSNSNDFIGAFGLGSKTPLCYTESFNVTSYKDNIQTNYLVYIDEQGFPKIQKVNQQKTKEPNGLKIQFGIHEYDFLTFKENILKFFAFNNLKPNLLNIDKTMIPDNPKLLYKYKNLKVVKSPFNQYTYDPLVTLGIVTYRVTRNTFDWNYVDDILAKKECAPAISNLVRSFIYEVGNNYQLLLDFPVGSLSVTASRESLSFDNKTKEIFYNNYVDLIIELYNNFQEQLKNVTTLDQLVEFQQKFPKFLINLLYNKYFSKDDFRVANQGYIYLKTSFFENKINKFNLKSPLLRFFQKQHNKFNFTFSPFPCIVDNDGILMYLLVGHTPLTEIRKQNLDYQNYTYLKLDKKESITEVASKLKKEFPNYIKIVALEEYKPNKTPTLTRKVEDTYVVYSVDIKEHFACKKFDKSNLDFPQTIYFLPKNKNGIYNNLPAKFNILKYFKKVDYIYILRTSQINYLRKKGYNLINIYYPSLTYNKAMLAIWKKDYLYNCFLNKLNTEIFDLTKNISITYLQPLYTLKTKLETKLVLKDLNTSLWINELPIFSKNYELINNFMRKLDNLINKELEQNPELIKLLAGCMLQEQVYGMHFSSNARVCKWKNSFPKSIKTLVNYFCK